MSDHSLIWVDIDCYLDDCPPDDCELDPSILPEIAKEINNRFNYSRIYDEIDRLCCAILRERGVDPSAPAQAGEQQ